MKKTDIYYGLADQERLDTAIEDVVDRVIDNAGRVDGVQWPIEIHEFRRMDVSGMADGLAKDALCRALETLDEEHSDPDGENTEATEKMKAAAAAFAKVVVEEYVPWACEKTGKAILVTREEALKMTASEVAP